MEGALRNIIIFIKKFLWKKYLKKYFLYMLDMVCQHCEDLKTTTALLCKNHLPIDLNNDIKKYIRCTQCDENEIKHILINILIKHSSKLSPFGSVSIMREELKDTDLVKYINIHSARHLSEMWEHFQNLVSRPRYYYIGSLFDIKNWRREQILNMKGKRYSHYLDLDILCYKVFLHQCAQHFSNQELDTMEKYLRKTFL